MGSALSGPVRTGTQYPHYRDFLWHTVTSQSTGTHSCPLHNFCLWAIYYIGLHYVMLAFLFSRRLCQSSLICSCKSGMSHLRQSQDSTGCICAPEHLHSGFASCSIVRQHPLAAFHSDSQQCQCQQEKAKGLKNMQ